MVPTLGTTRFPYFRMIELTSVDTLVIGACVGDSDLRGMEMNEAKQASKRAAKHAVLRV